MSLKKNNKKLNFLNDTVTMLVPKDCDVVFKDKETLEIFFTKDKYPVLGVNLECFENPKLNNIDKIQNHLNDNLNINSVIERNGDFFNLNYQVKIKDENLGVWKILHYLKPRSFRLIRFSLTWPNNKEADKIVDPILKKITEIISNLKFSDSKTLYDDLASLKYKISCYKYETVNFWGILNLKLPIKWVVEKNENEGFAKIFMDPNKRLQFLIEKFEIVLKNSKENKDKVVEKFLQEITKDVNISNAKLKKTKNNNYLFHFLAIEKSLKDQTKSINNQIWYRIKVLDNKLVIVSGVFEHFSEIELENKLYSEIINEIVGASEIYV